VSAVYAYYVAVDSCILGLFGFFWLPTDADPPSPKPKYAKRTLTAVGDGVRVQGVILALESKIACLRPRRGRSVPGSTSLSSDGLLITRPHELSCRLPFYIKHNSNNSLSRTYNHYYDNHLLLPRDKILAIWHDVGRV